MLYEVQAAFMAIVHNIPSKLHMLLSHQKRGLLLVIVLNASVITSSKPDKDSRGKGNLNLGNISTEKKLRFEDSIFDRQVSYIQLRSPKLLFCTL